MPNIMERAETALEFWDDESMWTRLIQRDLDTNDMEALAFHLDNADSDMEIAKRSEDIMKSFDLFVLNGETLNFPTLQRVPNVEMGDCES